MANEVTVVQLLGKHKDGDPIEYTIADGTDIAKGTVMEITDPRTVKKVSAADKALVGIAAYEKVASDGATTMAVLTNCIVKATAGASAATVGFHQVAEDGTNTLTDYDTLDEELGRTIGYALETAAAGETYLVRIEC